MDTVSAESSRRPLKSRGTRWAAAVARVCIKAKLRPNHISLLSIVFAAGGAACFVLSSRTHDPTIRALYLFGAAAGVQLRLLCNLMDGMVAIEGGFRTKSGELYNELPDRFADALLLVGAGYAITIPAWFPVIGWTAAVLAVITAYVRALGASMGAGQHFLGPMAKPHRMATLTLACLVDSVALLLGRDLAVLRLALWLIVIGCVVTIWRRCRIIVQRLEAK